MPDQYAKVTPSGEKARDVHVAFFGGLTRRVLIAALLMLASLPVLFLTAGTASAQDKTLKLYFVHTGERATITFKRNGKFDPKGLAQINQLLRDWRKNESAKMDPRLFDLVWEVYRRSGATDYINVVSAYRSPNTNNMLRTRSRNTGVAKNSQHMLGKAMDFFIPGVKLSTLRGLAMQMQVGGVGFYPTSGSPFVHLDVGSVRAWPRMSRQELVQIFPKGNTIHLPADGKPLPGYEQAMADYKRRVGPDGIQIASTAGGSIRGDSAPRRSTNLLAFLFGGGGADEEEDNEEVAKPRAVAQRPAPAAARPAASDDDDGEAPVAVAAAQPQAPEQSIVAPVPQSRPAFRSDAPAGGLATALYSQQRNPAQEALVWQTSPEVAAQAAQGSGFADLSAYNIPVPTLLGPRGQRGDAEPGIQTASVGAASALEDMASIPLPARRPGALMLPAEPTAIAAVKPEARPDTRLDDKQDLTPELVAALASSVEPHVQAAPVQQPSSAVAAFAAVPSAPAPARKPVETASASPKVIQPSRNQQFGDAFDVPRTPSTASMGSLPSISKGGRSGQPGQTASGGALTGDMVAKWALNKNRADAVASMKAPRVVNRTLNNEYSAGYASGGFKPVAAATAAIDSGRFGN